MIYKEVGFRSSIASQEINTAVLSHYLASEIFVLLKSLHQPSVQLLRDARSRYPYRVP